MAVTFERSGGAVVRVETNTVRDTRTVAGYDVEIRQLEARIADMQAMLATLKSERSACAST